jgi:hypothetical protein
MSDGRDLRGRPVFSHGLGVGDWRSRDLEEIRRNIETRVLPEEGPLRPLPSDPHVVTPQKGYGGDRILGVRGDVADPYWGRPHTTVLPPDSKVTPAPPKPPPMSGLTRHSAPGDPAVYGTDPRTESIRQYGGSAPVRGGLSDTVVGLQTENSRLRAAVGGLEQRDAARAAEMAEIRSALGVIEKRDGKTAARPKATRRHTKAKGVMR